MSGNHRLWYVLLDARIVSRSDKAVRLEVTLKSGETAEIWAPKAQFIERETEGGVLLFLRNWMIQDREKKLGGKIKAEMYMPGKHKCIVLA